MKKIGYILLVTLLFLAGVCSGQGVGSPVVRLTLVRSGSDLAIKIENTSDDYVRINKTLSMDPLVGVIHFVIRERGIERELQSTINAEPLSANSYLDLHPRWFYGGSFDLKLIQQMYGVVGPCYTLQVYYLDQNAKEFMAFDQKISSLPMKICIGLNSNSK
ncbi:hypothetical protein [Rhodanobacter soli]